MERERGMNIEMMGEREGERKGDREDEKYIRKEGGGERWSSRGEEREGRRKT